MNLVAFSIKTKGLHNFGRRLWTVFSRFGFSETKLRQSLVTIIQTMRHYGAAPTFFIPAVVLQRHPTLLAHIAGDGTEIGVHGYVHNDYRTLTRTAQYQQTQQAVSVFQQRAIPFQGFRNPYLGWTKEALSIFADLGFTYESNEAVHHDVIDSDALSPLLRSGYQKSLQLYQALPCSIYTLRPHFEGNLLRIPTSIPDDEMLFDRLRITDGREVGHHWCQIMQQVYDYGGAYVLNLHPERGGLCAQALDTLLQYARQQPLSVWIARLDEIAAWWKERRQFRFHISPKASGSWSIQASCTKRATLLARHLTVEDQTTTLWSFPDVRVCSQTFDITSTCCPCIGISTHTPQEVLDFLHEQGYPAIRCLPEEADTYALYLDMPEGLGTTAEKQALLRRSLVDKIEALETPLLHFGCWPDGHRAALSITGDIDSITVQDFFMRIIEVYQSK